MTLVEYGDYECPYCGQAELVIRELLDSFGDDVRYVWRHLPLNDVHPNAQMAAEAAEAATAQGAFWEMNDKLLQHQDELTPRRPDALRGGAGPRRRAVLGRAAAARVRGSRGRGRSQRRRQRGGRHADASSSTEGCHQGAYDIDTLTTAVERARRTALLRGAARAQPELERVP